MKVDKIAHLVTRLDSVGGAQIHVLALSKFWIQRGVDVQIWGGMTPAPEFEELPFTVRQVKNLVRDISLIDDFKAFIQIIILMRNERPDVVLIHSSKAGVLGRFAALVANTPCVFTAHGWVFTDGVPQPFRAISWLFEYVVGLLGFPVITVSRYDRKLALRWGVGRPNEIYVVHNGVEDIPLKLRANPYRSNVIVMVARHCLQKDHLTLLRALTKVNQAYELLLVGDGPDLEITKSHIGSLGLRDKVKILGARRDVEKILAEAGLFVLSTNWEGLPRSIIEAMRAGLPVVATDVGGNSELVRNTVNGYLVKHGDINGLARAIERLLTSALLRGKMGIESRNIYESDFSVERLFAQTLDILRAFGSESRAKTKVI